MDNRLRPESKKHIIRCAYKVLQPGDGTAAFVGNLAYTEVSRSVPL